MTFFLFFWLIRILILIRTCWPHQTGFRKVSPPGETHLRVVFRVCAWHVSCSCRSAPSCMLQQSSGSCWLAALMTCSSIQTRTEERKRQLSGQMPIVVSISSSSPLCLHFVSQVIIELASTCSSLLFLFVCCRFSFLPLFPMSVNPPTCVADSCRSLAAGRHTHQPQ